MTAAGCRYEYNVIPVFSGKACTWGGVGKLSDVEIKEAAVSSIGKRTWIPPRLLITSFTS
jgi:hypothetical protein